MNQPAGEITLTPDHYSQHLLPSDSTQEEEDADEAISDLGFTASVKSCYMFGSFHSPSSEETNVTPISGAENKAVDNQVCRKLLQDDSVTKFCLDSFASIASDDLFGSFRSPSNEQLNFTPLLSAEDQTKDIDDPGKLLLPVSEDTVSILDESCLHANVSQVILLQSEEPRAQGFDGRSRDNANSHPDNAYFLGTIPLSGTFTSQLSSSFGQSIDFTNVNSDYASPITMKMECSRENKIVLEYSDPDIDHHNIPWKTTSSRTGPILLKSSRARQCMTDKTFNKSTATQSQNRLVPVSSTEKAGSDEDEDEQADTCQGQIYHSPDNKDLDDTMKSLEISLPLVKTPLHSGTFIQEIPFSSPEEQLIIGEYSPNNALPQATPGVPSHDMAILIPNMPQTHAEVCLQRLTMPQPNIDAEVPSIGVPQPVAGKPMQHLPTSSQPAFPPPQLSLMDSMASLRPLVDSQAPQGAFSVHKAPRDITGHGSTALRTVRKEDENYVDMSGCQIQYKNALVNKNVHPGKTNFEELQQISYDCQPYAEEGFESDMEASSNVQVDPSESEMNTSSHPTVERLSLEDDAERFSSVDSDGYARFKERDDVDYLTPVFRDDFKPLKVRPKSSAEFPLPPVPGVQKRPFSVAAVPGDQKRSFSVADHHRNTELPLFQTVTEEIKSKQEKDQEADESQKMIRVRGLKSSHSLHALELFFENEKKSGGGEIEKLEWKKNKEEAVITFKHPSVVQSVLEKQKRESFYLEETRLTVEEYVPFSPDPIRLFLKNLSPSTTQELLVLYLEPCCKAIPVEILFKRLPGTALVTFSEPPDVEKLLVRVKEKPIEGQYIQVIRVPITRHVQLSGLLPSTTRDIIELYFNNTKHSGVGGPVADVRFGRDKQSCVVSFENVMDAERVCMRPHTIDKKEIQVCLYYECLDDDLHAVEFLNLTHGTEDTVGKLKLPGPVVVKDLKPPILKFLMKNEKHKQMFERNMSDINGIARWPSCVDMYLIIECTVKDEDKNSGVVLKDWSIKVADKVNSFAAGIEVAEFNTIQEAWDRVIMGLQARAVDNPEDVSVSLEKEKYNITVSGPKAAVEKLKKTVLNIIVKVETQVELEKQKVTEKKPMKTYEMTLLIETQFKQDIEEKYHGLSFDLNLKDTRAIFVGQADVVQKAVVQMHEKLKSFVSISMPMSKAAKDLLFAKENTDYIMQKMKSQKVIGVWDVDGTEEVHMFARDEREVQEAIQLVRDCLVEKDIKLDDVMVKNVQEEQWSQLVQRILKKHKQKVVIETKMMRVFIVAMDDVFQGVFDEIKIYLEKYNIQGLFLALEPVKVKFIQTYKMEDIKTLEKRFENSHVKLSIIDYGEQKGIKINGTEDGCNAVKTELTKLAKIIITKEHIIVEKAGLRKLLQSSRGKSQLSSVELKYRCFLVMMDSGTSNSLHLEGVSGGNSSGSEEDTGQSDEKMDKCAASVNVERIKDSVVQGEFVTQRTFSAVLDGNTPLSSSDDMSASSSSDVSIVHGICRYTLPHSVVLEIVQGDITMETTDVIVNSVLSNLNLIQGQVSKAVLTAGGSSIQQECQNKISDLKKDGFVVTNAGKLPCKMIIHILVKEKRKEWEDVIKRILFHADKLKFHSISFPGVGTGGRGLSAKMIAKAMYSACREFTKSEPNYLKKIRMVLFQEAVFHTIKDHVSDQVESKKSKLPALGKLFKGKSKQSSIVFSITIDSESKFQAAVKDLEGFIKNEFM